MSATGTIMRKKTPLAERVIQLSLYAIIAGGIAYYLSEYINDLMIMWGIPMQGETFITFISIVVGLLITTVLLFFMKRAYIKKGMSYNVDR